MHSAACSALAALTAVTSLLVTGVLGFLDLAASAQAIDTLEAVSAGERTFVLQTRLGDDPAAQRAAAAESLDAVLASPASPKREPCGAAAISSPVSEAQLVDIRRTRLGYVFQNYGLIPVLTAAENVELPLRIRGVDPVSRAHRVAEVLDLVGSASTVRNARTSSRAASSSATAEVMMDLMSSLVSTEGGRRGRHHP